MVVNRRRRRRGLFVTGVQANALLYFLDAACKTDRYGNVHRNRAGYSLEDLQKLRDKLFIAHEHSPTEECEIF